MSKFKNLLVIMVDQGCLYPVLRLPYEGKKGEMGVMLPPLSFYPLRQKDGPWLHMTCFLWCFSELCYEKILYTPFFPSFRPPPPRFHLLLAWLFNRKTRSHGRVLHEDSFSLTSSGHVIKPCSCFVVSHVPDVIPNIYRYQVEQVCGTFLSCVWISEEASFKGQSFVT